MTDANRQSGEKEERIIEIEIERLRPFKEHPFQVKDDKEMFLLQESIEKYGILNPLKDAYITAKKAGDVRGMLDAKFYATEEAD